MQSNKPLSVLKDEFRLRVRVLPPNLRDGLERYLFQGIMPGSFLSSVISGRDVMTVVRYSDWQSIDYIKELCTIISEVFPRESYGCEGAMVKWSQYVRERSLNETTECAN